MHGKTIGEECGAIHVDQIDSLLVRELKAYNKECGVHCIIGQYISSLVLVVVCLTLWLRYSASVPKTFTFHLND